MKNRCKGNEEDDKSKEETSKEKESWKGESAEGLFNQEGTEGKEFK